MARLRYRSLILRLPPCLLPLWRESFDLTVPHSSKTPFLQKYLVVSWHVRCIFTERPHDQGQPTAEFRQRSGQSVRCAIVFIEFENRRPARILRTEFNVLYIDERGTLDSNAQSQQLRLIGQSLDSDYLPGRIQTNVVDIRPRLARKKLRDKFEWTPSEEVLETIFRRCL